MHTTKGMAASIDPGTTVTAVPLPSLSQDRIVRNRATRLPHPAIIMVAVQWKQPQL